MDTIEDKDWFKNLTLDWQETMKKNMKSKVHFIQISFAERISMLPPPVQDRLYGFGIPFCTKESLAYYERMLSDAEKFIEKTKEHTDIQRKEKMKKNFVTFMSPGTMFAESTTKDN